MNDVMECKIKQMHAALDALTNADVSKVKSHVTRQDGHTYCLVDFNEDSDPIALANAAQLLTANIASIKDHLHSWCKKNGALFTGDACIDGNKSVALIHDLWNVDKHAELNRPPRSGITPRLRNIATTLNLSAGTQAGSAAFFSMDPRTGKVTSGTTGEGSVRLIITAEIIDEQGDLQGDFFQTCEAAIDAWHLELTKAGVPLPGPAGA